MKRRIRLILAVVVFALGSLGTVMLAAPATAHTGGEAVARVQEFHLEPSENGGWNAVVTVVDADSGEPIQGISLGLEGESGGESFGPTALKPSGEDGVYSAAVNAQPGGWSLTVSGRQAPGAEELREFSNTYHVELIAGEKAEVVQDSTGGFWIMVLAFAAVVVVGGVTLLAWGARRKSRVTVSGQTQVGQATPQE